MTGINRIYPYRSMPLDSLLVEWRKSWFQLLLWGVARARQDACFLALGAAVAGGRRTVLLVPAGAPLPPSGIIEYVDAVIYDWDDSPRVREVVKSTVRELQKKQGIKLNRDISNQERD